MRLWWLVMVGENGVPMTPDFHVPVRTFCARLLGDDDCDCPSCQLDAAVLTARIAADDGVRHTLADVFDEFQVDAHEPLDCRGEN